jgi:glutaredoxin
MKDEFEFYNFDGKLVFKTNSKKKAREFLKKHNVDDVILNIDPDKLIELLKEVRKNERRTMPRMRYGAR